VFQTDLKLQQIFLSLSVSSVLTYSLDTECDKLPNDIVFLITEH